MSAQLDTLPKFRRMRHEDLAAVERIERAVYTHPWTPGNFADSLEAGYQCWVMECGGVLAGYAVVMVAAEEAHLLNLSIAADWQRRGLGMTLLQFINRQSEDCGARTVFLEVRASNTAGRALYARDGYSEIGRRRDYYPSSGGREDAVSMEKKLS